MCEWGAGNSTACHEGEEGGSVGVEVGGQGRVEGCVEQGAF